MLTLVFLLSAQLSAAAAHAKQNDRGPWSFKAPGSFLMSERISRVKLHAGGGSDSVQSQVQHS